VGLMLFEVVCARLMDKGVKRRDTTRHESHDHGMAARVDCACPISDVLDSLQLCQSKFSSVSQSVYSEGWWVWSRTTTWRRVGYLIIHGAVACNRMAAPARPRHDMVAVVLSSWLAEDQRQSLKLLISASRKLLNAACAYSSPRLQPQLDSTCLALW